MGGHFALTGSVSAGSIGWARPANSTGEAVSDTPADENARNDEPRRRQQPGRPARGGDGYRPSRNDGDQRGRPRAGGASRDRSSTGGDGPRRADRPGGGDPARRPDGPRRDGSDSSRGRDRN